MDQSKYLKWVSDYYKFYGLIISVFVLLTLNVSVTDKPYEIADIYWYFPA